MKKLQTIFLRQQVKCTIQRLEESITHTLTFKDVVNDTADISGFLHTPRFAVPAPYVYDPAWTNVDFQSSFEIAQLIPKAIGKDIRVYANGVWRIEDADHTKLNRIQSLKYTSNMPIGGTFKLRVIKGVFDPNPPNDPYNPVIPNGNYDTNDIQFDATAQDIEDALNDAVGLTGFSCSGSFDQFGKILVECVGPFEELNDYTIEVLELDFDRTRPEYPNEDFPTGVLIKNVQYGYSPNYELDENDVWVETGYNSYNHAAENIKRLDHLNIRIYSALINWLVEINDKHGFGLAVDFKRFNGLLDPVDTTYEDKESTTYIAEGTPYTPQELYEQVRDFIELIATSGFLKNLVEIYFWNALPNYDVSTLLSAQNYIGTAIHPNGIRRDTIMFTPENTDDLIKNGKYKFVDFLSLLPIKMSTQFGYFTWKRLNYDPFSQQSYPFYVTGRADQYVYRKYAYSKQAVEGIYNYQDLSPYTWFAVVGHVDSVRPISDFNSGTVTSLFLQTGGQISHDTPSTIIDFGIRRITINYQTESTDNGLVFMNDAYKDRYVKLLNGGNSSLPNPGAGEAMSTSVPRYTFTDNALESDKLYVMRTIPTLLPTNVPVKIRAITGSAYDPTGVGGYTDYFFNESSTHNSLDITASIFETMIDEANSAGNTCIDGSVNGLDSVYVLDGIYRPPINVYNPDGSIAYVSTNSAWSVVAGASSFSEGHPYYPVPFKQNVIDVNKSIVVSDGVAQKRYGLFVDNLSQIKLSADLTDLYNLPASIFAVVDKSYIIYLVDTGGLSLRQYLGLKFLPTTIEDFIFWNYLNQTYSHNSGFVSNGGVGYGSFFGTGVASYNNFNDIDFEVNSKCSFGSVNGYCRLQRRMYADTKESANGPLNGFYDTVSDNEKQIIDDVVSDAGTELYSVTGNPSNKGIKQSVTFDPNPLADYAPTGNLIYIKHEIEAVSSEFDSLTNIVTKSGATVYAGQNFFGLSGISDFRPNIHSNPYNDSAYGTNKKYSENNGYDKYTFFRTNHITLNTEEGNYSPYGVPK